jgi:hypothetical protein
MFSSNKWRVKPLIEERIQRMMPLLNERQRRLYLANEAVSYGRGGVSLVSRISGMSRTTITKALEELNNEHTIDGNIRRSGGGRKFVELNYPGIEEKVRKIIDGKTYGDPMRVLSYTTESLRKIQTELEKDSIFVGHVTIGKILEAMGYSKQSNQKMLQTGKPHPDRNAQFEGSAGGRVEPGGRPPGIIPTEPDVPNFRTVGSRHPVPLEEDSHPC